MIVIIIYSSFFCKFRYLIFFYLFLLQNILFYRALEIELNSSESGPVNSSQIDMKGFDPCQALLAVWNIVNAISIVASTSHDRISALSPSSSPPLPRLVEKGQSVIQGDLLSALTSLEIFGETLSRELIVAADFLDNLEGSSKKEDNTSNENVNKKKEKVEIDADNVKARPGQDESTWTPEQVCK